MAQDRTIKQFSDFNKGLNTEASPLNFPEGFSLDEDNMILNINGSRQRRQGIDFETGGALTTTTTANTAVSMSFFHWDNADNKATNSIGVVQVGTDLYFMDMTTDAPSANLLNSGAAVTLVTTTSTPRLSFASLNGVLLIASDELTEPLYLEYDTTGDSVSQNTISIEVRDIWGVDDGLDVDEHPASLSDLHNYNLLNQGWRADRITQYNTTNSEYPNNAEVEFVGKQADGTWGASGATLVAGTDFGTSPAAKGRYVLNFFTRGDDRETLSGVSNLPSDTEGGALSAVTSNFGRVFWAGIASALTDGDAESPNASSLILFTQIIENNNQLGRCYQEADPSSEQTFDLVDTDGGFISIPEMGQVLKLLPLNNQIIVLASNGIWSIVAENGVFTPTDFAVNKVTDVGAISAESAVEVEGTLVYWSQSGIYQLSLQELSQRAEVSDVTLQTIKTFYNGITTKAKENCKGYYDSIRKQVGWLYMSDPSHNFTNFPDHTDQELVYDLQLEAFFKNTHSSKSVASPYVVGAIFGENLATSSQTLGVTINGGVDNIQVNSGADEVVVTTSNTIQTTSKLKYLTFVPGAGGFAQFTLSTYQNTGFLDWVTEDYTSFFQTGFFSYGDFVRMKGQHFLVCHFERTENGFDAMLNPLNESSCMVHPRWEWNNTTSGNRWGTPFQTYRYRRPYVPVNTSDPFDTGQSIITTRNKLRGHGKSMSLYFESETGKDMRLLGFGMTVTGRQDV